jgi:D-lactate dehydrogenase (cytochrome)
MKQVPIDSLRALLPDSQVSTHADHLAVAAKDESSLEPVLPRAIVWANTAEEIRKVIQWCYETETAVTLRGGGSALEGSAIPSPDSIVLDTSRMTKVIDYWPDDLQVKVEPGIIYDNLNAYLKKDGLFFPPSPGGSGNLATIGGMVSTNASGIYTVRYGATKDYLLSLDIVTGTGKQMTIGSRALKRSSGYNLVDLICGSEGTLAAITAITLKVSGLPETRKQSAFTFPTETPAAKAVSTIRQYGIDIAAIEFLDRRVMEALNLLKNYQLTEAPSLFLEFHGSAETCAASDTTASEICIELGGERITLPNNQNPWEIRHYVTESIKHRKPGYAIIRNDIAFPISALPRVVDFCLAEAEKVGLMIHIFGHVGMGLLHALILARRDNHDEWTKGLALNTQIIRKAIFENGTISGEHGIGMSHVHLLTEEHGDSVELMKSIKKEFDPDGILNPGKVLQ